MNKFPIIEFHILQSFPVSCLNRDDTNSPKTCVIGGIERARVSSQCWKRSVRLSLRDFDIKLGIRTKKVAEGIEKSLKDKGCAEEAVIKSAQEVSKLIAEDSLTFFTDKEYEAIADLLLDKKSVKIGDISKVIKKGKIQVLNGLDIALFGRMVAKAPSMNVEAAASFSHAISTHSVAPEMDFFTAIDDCKVNNEDESGAAHMGVSEYSSATYYRYISLNIEQLKSTLGLEDNDLDSIKSAIKAFVKALYVAIPGARQATMSAACPWNYAKVLVRNGHRMQCAFEKPVLSARTGGYLEASIQLLQQELQRQEKLSGSLYGKIDEFEFGQNENYSIDHLIKDLQCAVGA